MVSSWKAHGVLKENRWQICHGTRDEGRWRTRRGLHRVVLFFFSNNNLVNSYIVSFSYFEHIHRSSVLAVSAMDEAPASQGQCRDGHSLLEVVPCSRRLIGGFNTGVMGRPCIFFAK